MQQPTGQVTHVPATYAHGVLTPMEPLNLEEGSEVTPLDTAATNGSLPLIGQESPDVLGEWTLSPFCSMLRRTLTLRSAHRSIQAIEDCRRRER